MSRRLVPAAKSPGYNEVGDFNVTIEFRCAVSTSEGGKILPALPKQSTSFDKFMITLIASDLREDRPDLMLLKEFERYCIRESDWKSANGPTLFKPLRISSRLYTLAHEVLKPLLSLRKTNGAVLSLGFPSKNLLYGKTFPYFAQRSDLRVLWCYDVWPRQYPILENLIHQAKLDLVLISSYQASKHFQSLDTGKCVIEWVPETINPADYKWKSWDEKEIDVLAFGRVYSKYHDLIAEGLKSKGISYSYQVKNDQLDVTRQGLQRELLQFPTQESFVAGLANARISVCFPRSLTHPDIAGDISTITLRYLESMASKCLVVGSIPIDAKHLFDYDPFVEVDWNDPVGQIEYILSHPHEFVPLIEKNYEAVCSRFSYRSAIGQMTSLIERELSKKGL